ncbi:MAG: hypothetical protein K8T25_16575 [Planctomycetia bacterium]|nr:hypothetical protein [Planctomycetia bacterium]
MNIKLAARLWLVALAACWLGWLAVPKASAQAPSVAPPLLPASDPSSSDGFNFDTSTESAPPPEPMPPGSIAEPPRLISGPLQPAIPGQPANIAPQPLPTREDDFTVASLRRAAGTVLARYGGDYRRVPLEEKAEFLEWAMWRYNLSPEGQIANVAELPNQIGVRPTLPLDSDTSTWNGTLLSALCWKYAVTRDPQTLERIAVLLRGLAFYSEVTGKAGCYARSVASIDQIADKSLEKFGAHEYSFPDGRRWAWVGDPARGTYNQLAGGFASLMMYAAPSLPVEVQTGSRRQADDLVMHVLDNNYHITGPDGRPTTYGDLTPIVSTVGIPFNAQVAYLIVALGEQYPPSDTGQKGSIEHQFYFLRAKHHAYYADPWKSLIRPQRVGANPLVKGANDRFHLMWAAYHSLALEMERARLDNRPLDSVFMYRMGQTLFWTMRKSATDRNALCNFMYAGMLGDPTRFEMIIDKSDRAEVSAQLTRGLVDGVEQLRRFSLDRFRVEGQSQLTDSPQWVDVQQPDDFHWKADPTLRFTRSGAATNKHVAAIDYLAAYWLMRLHGLDRQPVVTRGNAEVLGTRQ